MNDIDQQPSLTAYLEHSGAPFWLELVQWRHGDDDPDGKPSPPLRILQQDAFTRLIAVQLKSDYGSRLRDLFARVQSDTYPAATDQNGIINNIQLEQFWQAFFLKRCGQGEVQHPVILSGQVDRQGRLVPFKPLFFCQICEEFFHPPCPVCNAELTLCREDRLLEDAGLAPYCNSLRRYLYCASCWSRSGTAQFYAYSRQADEPRHLKDRHELIRAYAATICDAADRRPQLPCRHCRHIAGCKTGETISAKMGVFSFYPFFMLLEEAYHLRAADFQKCLADASAQQARPKAGLAAALHDAPLAGETISSKASFLFDDPSRRWLEILYLKLCLIDEIRRLVDADDLPMGAASSESLLNGMWVKLPEPAGLLPRFWNFRLGWLSDPLHLQQTLQIGETSAQQRCRQLATAFFEILLTNRQQDFGVLLAKLNQLVARIVTESQPTAACLTLCQQDPRLSPQGLYWDPEHGRVATAGAESLWQAVLENGCHLLAAAMDPARAPDAWHTSAQRLRQLSVAVHARLFSSGPPNKTMAAESDHQQASPSDKKIAVLLNTIHRKWRTNQTSSVPVGTLPSNLVETIMEKTVRIAADDAGRLFEKQRGNKP